MFIIVFLGDEVVHISSMDMCDDEDTHIRHAQLTSFCVLSINGRLEHVLSLHRGAHTSVLLEYHYW